MREWSIMLVDIHQQMSRPKLVFSCIDYCALKQLRLKTRLNVSFGSHQDSWLHETPRGIRWFCPVIMLVVKEWLCLLNCIFRSPYCIAFLLPAEMIFETQGRSNKTKILVKLGACVSCQILVGKSNLLHHITSLVYAVAVPGTRTRKCRPARQRKFSLINFVFILQSLHRW